ncbi:hypothetical protein AB1Y20_009356 [Prymnesium parvum]|uniref:Galectin n=1 Tax=Prymnesium parvum TaxID=97485 RepID=A0AB34K1D5_PRYPA
MATLEGVYDFQHPGGNFEVHLRSKNRFFCPKFQAKATWELKEEGGEHKLYIDWGKFGKYELVVDLASKAASGSAVGKPESWRKMAFKRPFCAAELALFDSEWSFIHPKGDFKVEFRADGYNHFVCPDFPAHSHWRVEDDSPTPTVYINFGKYGEYLVKLSEDGSEFEGAAKGDPSNWRKGKRLGNSDTSAVHEHDH